VFEIGPVEDIVGINFWRHFFSFRNFFGAIFLHPIFWRHFFPSEDFLAPFFYFRFFWRHFFTSEKNFGGSIFSCNDLSQQLVPRCPGTSGRRWQMAMLPYVNCFTGQIFSVFKSVTLSFQWLNFNPAANPTLASYYNAGVVFVNSKSRRRIGSWVRTEKTPNLTRETDIVVVKMGLLKTGANPTTSKFTATTPVL
jgi:hypothetical protein